MKTLRVEYTSFSETPIPHIEEALNISWADVAGWRVLRNVLFIDMYDGRKLAHPLNMLSEIDLDKPTKIETTDTHQNSKSLVEQNSEITRDLANTLQKSQINPKSELFAMLLKENKPQ